MRRRLSVLLGLLLLLVIGLACWIFREQLTLAFLIEQDRRLRQLVTDFPVASFLVGFLIYVAAAFVPGTTGKATVYGWIFGFWAGLVIANVGLTVVAVIEFLAIRYTFSDLVHARLGPWIRRIDAALRREGAFYLLTLRLLHSPYTLMNYAAGATAVPTRTFWWTTQLGMLPGNIAFVLAGSQLPSLEQFAEKGPWSLVNFRLLLGLTLTALIPVAVRWIARHWQGANHVRDCP